MDAAGGGLLSSWRSAPESSSRLRNGRALVSESFFMVELIKLHLDQDTDAPAVWLVGEHLYGSEGPAFIVSRVVVAEMEVSFADPLMDIERENARA